MFVGGYISNGNVVENEFFVVFCEFCFKDITEDSELEGLNFINH